MANAPNTGFVSFADYLNANQDALNNTGTKLANLDAQAAQSAEGQANTVGHAAQGQDPTSLPDYANAQGAIDQASQNIQGLTDQGSLATQLEGGAFKDSPTQANFDATLLGGSQGAQQAFQNTQNQYQSLADYLSGATAPLPPSTSGIPHTPPPFPKNNGDDDEGDPRGGWHNPQNRGTHGTEL